MPEDRHSRQERCAAIGPHGQKRIRDARVLIVGLGALGTHVAEALLRAGVGRLQLVDRDIVEASNLQRQVLFDAADAAAGRPKASAAATRLAAIDATCELTPIVAEFDAALFDTLAPPDVIVDGTDNFATRLLINDLAVRSATPWIYGAAVGTTGRAAIITPPRTPCLRCLLPAPPPGGELGTCETVGILEPAIAHVAAFQTTETLRLLVTNGAEFTPGVFVIDVWAARFERRMRHAAGDPECPTCGLRQFPTLSAPTAGSVSLCGRNAVQVQPRDDQQVDLERLADQLRDRATCLDQHEHMLRFELDGHRFTVFRGGRALIFGTADVVRARALYDRHIGG